MRGCGYAFLGALILGGVLVLFNPGFWGARLQWIWGGADFYFEGFEDLGGNAASVDAAKQRLLVLIPYGTTLAVFNDFAAANGWRCVSMSKDYQNGVVCFYSHPKFFYMPFYPAVTRWAVIAEFSAAGQMNKITVTAGSEGL
jgi:hypothetical protein